MNDVLTIIVSFLLTYLAFIGIVVLLFKLFFQQEDFSDDPTIKETPTKRKDSRTPRSKVDPHHPTRTINQ